MTNANPAAATLRLMLAIGHTPDQVAAVVRHQQRAVVGGRNADRPTPDALAVDDEAGEEVLVGSVGHAVLQVHADDLVAGALAAVPRPMQRHESVAPILRREGAAGV